MTEERLARIEADQARILSGLENISEKVDEGFAHADERHARMELVIYGDGNGRKGHNIRLDRLEQTAERQKWLVRTIGGGLLLLAARAAVSFLTR